MVDRVERLTDGETAPQSGAVSVVGTAEAAVVTEAHPPAALSPEDTAPLDSRRHVLRLPGVMQKGSLLGIWVLLIALFSITVPSTFLTHSTLSTLLGDNAITAIMAISLVMPIAANTFDLSIGGNMGFAVIVPIFMMSRWGVNPAEAILAALAVGLLIGIVNAFVVVVLRVNSFIATLATGTILLALQNWVTGGNEIVNNIPKSFTRLGQSVVIGIPIPFFYMVVISAVIWYILDYRKFGRYLYASGSNADAARLAGVRTNRLRATTLVVSAVIATVAGIIFGAQIGSASVSVGTAYLLPAFAAVFLGATQFKEGAVNVPGTLVAVYVLATGVQGLELMGAPFWVNDLFDGVALIIAVAFAVRSGRQRIISQ